MESCDALIVGGGPAGSTLAWKLARAGLAVTLLEKEKYPREKLCGGWITPAVIDGLDLNLAEYAQGRVLQPITGFRTGRIGRQCLETRYGGPVSYGIRRCEFDAFLAWRCRARVLEGMPLTSLERTRDGWILNDRFRTPLLIGAGGHYCPVARALGANPREEAAVVAREAEFLLDRRQREACPVQGEIPELYFCSDLKGYGWCFRKGDYLNVGLGRVDRHGLNLHLNSFLASLSEAGRIPAGAPAKFAGHAYLLYGNSHRRRVAEGAMLIGDAAGLAFQQSGEGIRPAIESGALAARVILGAEGKYSSDRLEPYCDLLEARFKQRDTCRASALSNLWPDSAIALVAGFLLASPSFTRHVLLDRWFLRTSMRALVPRASARGGIAYQRGSGLK